MALQSMKFSSHGFGADEKAKILQGYKAAVYLLNASGRNELIAVLKRAIRAPHSVHVGTIIDLMQTLMSLGFDSEEDSLFLLLSGLNSVDSVALAKVQGRLNEAKSGHLNTV
ncbi:MAG: hypothetical protein OQJ95_00990 [Kangiella sp.]|nr:hypothetical protein [Kangiella sp.]MCW9029657.1 hypothetical protein [Kangiella sp.]